MRTVAFRQHGLHECCAPASPPNSPWGFMHPSLLQSEHHALQVRHVRQARGDDGLPRARVPVQLPPALRPRCQSHAIPEQVPRRVQGARTTVPERSRDVRLFATSPILYNASRRRYMSRPLLPITIEGICTFLLLLCGEPTCTPSTCCCGGGMQGDMLRSPIEPMPSSGENLRGYTAACQAGHEGAVHAVHGTRAPRACRPHRRRGAAGEAEPRGDAGGVRAGSRGEGDQQTYPFSTQVLVIPPCNTPTCVTSRKCRIINVGVICSVLAPGLAPA